MPGVDILQSISTTRGLMACTVEVLFIFHLKMVKLSNSFEAIKKGGENDATCIEAAIHVLSYRSLDGQNQKNIQELLQMHFSTMFYIMHL